MIPAQEHPLLTPLVRNYLIGLAKVHFSTISLKFEDEAEARGTQHQPTLFQATHVSWWDGSLALLATRALGLEPRALMLESEARQYPFLRFAGAIGMQRTGVGDLRATIRELIREIHTPPTRGLWIFPAGRIHASTLRPLPDQGLVAHLAMHMSPILVRSIAWRLEHRGRAKPEAFIRIGRGEQITDQIDLKTLKTRLRADLTRVADDLAFDLEHTNDERGLPSYQPILKGISSIDEIWGSSRQWLQQWAKRGLGYGISPRGKQ